MLIRELNDPRLKQIYLTDVKVDKELAYADIFVSAMEGTYAFREILAGLESASGFIRRTLAGARGVARFPTAAFSLGPNTRERRSH